MLAVLVLYRLYVKPAAMANYLTLAAILLSTGILSHYEGVLAALPAAMLLAQRRCAIVICGADCLAPLSLQRRRAR